MSSDDKPATSRRRRSSILKPAASTNELQAVKTHVTQQKVVKRTSRRVSFAEKRTVTVLHHTDDHSVSTHHEPAYVDSSNENSKLSEHAQKFCESRQETTSHRSIAMDLADSFLSENACGQSVAFPPENTAAFFLHGGKGVPACVGEDTVSVPVEDTQKFFFNTHKKIVSEGFGLEVEDNTRMEINPADARRMGLEVEEPTAMTVYPGDAMNETELQGQDGEDDESALLQPVPGVTVYETSAMDVTGVENTAPLDAEPVADVPQCNLAGNEPEPTKKFLSLAPKSQRPVAVASSGSDNSTESPADMSLTGRLATRFTIGGISACSDDSVFGVKDDHAEGKANYTVTPETASPIVAQRALKHQRFATPASSPAGSPSTRSPAVKRVRQPATEPVQRLAGDTINAQNASPQRESPRGRPDRRGQLAASGNRSALANSLGPVDASRQLLASAITFAEVEQTFQEDTGPAPIVEPTRAANESVRSAKDVSTAGHAAASEWSQLFGRQDDPTNKSVLDETPAIRPRLFKAQGSFRMQDSVTPKHTHVQHTERMHLTVEAKSVDTLSHANPTGSSEDSRVDLDHLDTSLVPNKSAVSATEQNATCQASPVIRTTARQQDSTYRSQLADSAEEVDAGGRDDRSDMAVDRGGSHAGSDECDEAAAAVSPSGESEFVCAELRPPTVVGYDVYTALDRRPSDQRAGQVYGRIVLREADAKLLAALNTLREKNESMMEALSADDAKFVEALRNGMIPKEMSDLWRAFDADASSLWLQYNAKMATALTHAYKLEEKEVLTALETLKSDFEQARQRQRSAQEMLTEIERLQSRWRPVVDAGGVSAIQKVASILDGGRNDAKRLEAEKENVKKMRSCKNAKRMELMRAAREQVKLLTTEFEAMRAADQPGPVATGCEQNQQFIQISRLLGVTVLPCRRPNECTVYVNELGVEFALAFDPPTCTRLQAASCRLAPLGRFALEGGAHAAALDWVRRRVPVGRLNDALRRCKRDSADNMRLLHACLARVANVQRFWREIDTVLSQYAGTVRLRFGAKCKEGNVIEFGVQGGAGVGLVWLAVCVGDDLTTYPMPHALRLVDIHMDNGSNEPLTAECVPAWRLTFSDVVLASLGVSDNGRLSRSSTVDMDESALADADARPLVMFAEVLAQ